ncbi:MAG: hypothetical protein DME22_07285 [Verrucomicrobia bacterium]|nr:MAG: hypothetical protein DME22_07285 [Verrucomicrobiota bacterium]PYJ94717.1 MAG: hypothetical protein DME23_24850 [Verrucomicrobiota bacterium]
MLGIPFTRFGPLEFGLAGREQRQAILQSFSHRLLHPGVFVRVNELQSSLDVSSLQQRDEFTNHPFNSLFLIDVHARSVVTVNVTTNDQTLSDRCGSRSLIWKQTIKIFRDVQNETTHTGSLQRF